MTTRYSLVTLAAIEITFFGNIVYILYSIYKIMYSFHAHIELPHTPHPRLTPPPPNNKLVPKPSDLSP